MITSFVFIAAFVLALPMLWISCRVCTRIGLVDLPNERKRHRGEVPLAGGMGIYVTMVIIAIVVDLVLGPAMSVGCVGGIALILGGSALLLGALDDALDLDPKLRLVCQTGIALVLAMVFDVRIDSLGNVLGTGDIRFDGGVAVVFTTFCVVGALNATNMTDGLDGLLASLIAASLGALTILTLLASGVAPELLCVVAIGALAAFLVLNLGVFGDRHRVFLGDSGSTLLGLLIAVLLVGYSRPPNQAIEPVVAGWLLGLPLLDTTVVVLRRVQRGCSPLRAGRDHLHHLLQAGGLTAGRTLIVMLGVHVAMLGIGVLAQLSSLPAWIFFGGFIALTLLHFVFTACLASKIERDLRTAAVGRERLRADHGIDLSRESMGKQSTLTFPHVPAFQVRPNAAVPADGELREDERSREVVDAVPD